MAENASTVLFELKVPPLWPEKFGPGKKNFGRDRQVVKKSFYFILFLSKIVAAAKFNSPSCCLISRIRRIFGSNPETLKS